MNLFDAIIEIGAKLAIIPIVLFIALIVFIFLFHFGEFISEIYWEIVLKRDRKKREKEKGEDK